MSDNKMETAAVQLSSMVQFQNGSIVSREIIKKPTGTITLFAFDEGQGLSEHTAPFDAMVQAVEGEVEITLSGKPHLLKTGDMIVMPAGEAHALKAITKFKMLLVMIKN